MPKSTKSRRAQAPKLMATANVPSTETNRANLAVDTAPAIEPDQDGLEPEQVQQYGEEDVPGSEEAPVTVINEDELDDYFEIVVSPGNSCACGCRQPVTTSDRVTRYFRQGHDQRLIGILAGVAAEGREVGFVDGGMLVTGSAQSYGARFLKDGGLAKLDVAIKRAVEKATKPKRGRKAAGLATCEHGNLTAFPCTECENAVAGPGSRRDLPSLGDEIKVKIGRHVYFARIHGMSQAGKVTAIAYRTKSDPNTEKTTDRFVIVD